MFKSLSSFCALTDNASRFSYRCNFTCISVIYSNIRSSQITRFLGIGQVFCSETFLVATHLYFFQVNHKPCVSQLGAIPKLNNFWPQHAAYKLQNAKHETKMHHGLTLWLPVHVFGLQGAKSLPNLVLLLERMLFLVFCNSNLRFLTDITFF